MRIYLTISHTSIFGNSHWHHGNYRVWNILQQKFTYCNKQCNIAKNFVIHWPWHPLEDSFLASPPILIDIPKKPIQTAPFVTSVSSTMLKLWYEIKWQSKREICPSTNLYFLFLHVSFEHAYKRLFERPRNCHWQ